MDQRVAFIAEWLREAWTMTELAGRYGISRKTAYKWVERYEAEPAAGLGDRSRAPHQHGRAMAPAVAAAVVALRRQQPTWGPKKLRAVLQRRQPATAWPAPSTIGDLLRREGLSAPQRRTRHTVPLTQPLADAVAPNDVWCIDFKGWFRTQDGTRCDPLTVTDAWSRYVLCCRITPPSGRGVRPWLERTFREHGLPRALRSDNGPPFATTGAGRLSQLAVWWLKLGIALDRITPGAPQENGRHERVHLTLQRDTSTPPAPTPRAQQRRFDAHRRLFNEERPHEALAMQPPATRYQGLAPPYPTRLEDPWYDAQHHVRRVKRTGQIKWHGGLVFISEALRGELVDWRKHLRGTGPSAFCRSSWGASRATPIDLPRAGWAAASRPPGPDGVTHLSGSICYRCFRLHRAWALKDGFHLCAICAICGPSCCAICGPSAAIVGVA
ncbi:MAG: helix-turn-helix domain-containing protein [Vicinamibacterales bacterium]